VKSERLDLRVAAAFCGAVGLYDLVYVILLLSGGPLIGSTISVPFADFLVFHAAVRAWLEGKAGLIYDLTAFTDFQNTIYLERFGRPRHFRPFLYPPIWLLMLLPLGALAVGKAAAVFLAGTAALATAIEGRRDWWGWLAVITSPAAVWAVIAGQNTFLSVALLYGGLRLLDRAPVAAGILLGLLAYKPQVWLLVPLALLAARQWRALAWALGTVLALSLASLGVFGLDFWRSFFDAAREAGTARFADQMFEHVYMHMVTLVAAARIAGLPPGAAGAVQLAGSALAALAVWVAFRRHGSGAARTAVLVSATLLVSPYTLNYDLLLLMPAVVALFRRGAAEGFYPGERMLYFLLWLVPTIGLALNQLGVPIMPLLVLWFGAVAWRRLQAAAKVELPAGAAAR
jgi:hypothetical protein